MHGHVGMAEPDRTRLVGVNQSAEPALVVLPLGSLIDESALITRKRQRGLVVLEKILPHLRPDVLEQETQVPNQRIIAKDCMARLQNVSQANQEKPEKNHRQR